MPVSRLDAIVKYTPSTTNADNQTKHVKPMYSRAYEAKRSIDSKEFQPNCSLVHKDNANGNVAPCCNCEIHAKY